MTIEHRNGSDAPPGAELKENMFLEYERHSETEPTPIREAPAESAPLTPAVTKPTDTEQLRRHLLQRCLYAFGGSTTLMLVSVGGMAFFQPDATSTLWYALTAALYGCAGLSLAFLFVSFVWLRPGSGA